MRTNANAVLLLHFAQILQFSPKCSEIKWSLLAVDLQLSEACRVHMQFDVVHNVYPVPAVYQRIFN